MTSGAAAWHFACPLPSAFCPLSAFDWEGRFIEQSREGLFYLFVLHDCAEAAGEDWKASNYAVATLVLLVLGCVCAKKADRGGGILQ